MKTRIDDLLSLHNEMWITLHRMNKALTYHKKITTDPHAYYEVFAKHGELEKDIAEAEKDIADYTNQYQELNNQLKNLTETI